MENVRYTEKDIRSLLNWFWCRNVTRNITSIYRLDLSNWSNRYHRWAYVAILLTKGKGVRRMKIVVKKVPKFLRGFVKFVFGIKENT